MSEMVGKVILNTDFYSGTDLYSDGDVEDELLAIVKSFSIRDFPGIIIERKSWPILYHLSPIRENIVEWIDISPEATVLEVGAGCGAVTGALAQKSKKVTCVELSKKRSTINATRNREKDNIEIFVGNFQDIEDSLPKYDVITLIGVLEYAKSYIRSKEPYMDFLKIIWKHLNPNGKLIVAIENKLGMKYWAGCREDHTGKYFDSLEGYPGDSHAITFSRSELERLLTESGYQNTKFFYPYPDYKLPMTIYSDGRLPSKKELRNNERNFDAERFSIFDESKVFDSVIDAGLFREFSNSFLVISQKGSI